MAPHLPFIVPQRLVDRAGIIKGPHQPSLFVALQFDDEPSDRSPEPERSQAGQGSLVLVQYLPGGALAPLQVPHLSCSEVL
jgi:hypothetical protein